MDGSRGHQLWNIQHQIRRLVLWGSADRNNHLWKNTLSRYNKLLGSSQCIKSTPWYPTELLVCNRKIIMETNLLLKFWFIEVPCAFFPHQEWPTQRWSDVWTDHTGCHDRRAVLRNSMTLWWCVGSRSLRTGLLLNFCKTLSMTSSLPRRDNMKCSHKL